MTALRSYQQDIYNAARSALGTHRAVCIQLATGGGKTPVASAMVSSVFEKKKRAWFITPRRELVKQASEHFRKWSVPHGMITAGSIESRAYNIHIVSKETLTRRWDKIKNWPDLIIIDEGHLNLDFQVELYRRAPQSTKFILYTATPERLDGRGLSLQSGGIADILITGPSIPWLTERGFLSPLRYFSPPLEGLADLHVRGTDYDEEELDALLQRRKIYGEVVGHYEKYGRGKPALGFCRSVKSAYQMAERFRDKGFNFHTVEGRMPAGRLRDLLTAHRNGEIDGLTTCDLVLYGVDIPRVEYGFSVRPTLSRSLYMQMIGRVLRPFEGKESAIWMDHVNMVLEHQDDKFPGVPLHYVPEITWNFHGIEKRKRDKSQKNVVLCPHLDFMYCNSGRCASCSHNPDHTVTDARRPMVVIPATLQEIKPVPMAERPLEERREIQDQICRLVLEYKRIESTPLQELIPGFDIPFPKNLNEKGQVDKIIAESHIFSGPVGELLKIADSLGYPYPEMWVYHKLTAEGRFTKNVPLLSEIARIRGFKPGWVWVVMNKMNESNKQYNKSKEKFHSQKQNSLYEKIRY